MKYMMKAMESEMEVINDIDTIVMTTFATITATDCEAWISGIGIY